MAVNKFEIFETRLRKYLCDLRSKSGITQKELAASSPGLRQSTIAKYENGLSPHVTLKTIYEIANAYHLTLSQLVNHAEIESNKASIKEDSWTLIEREAALLSPQKRKWLSRIFKEILNSEK